MPNDLIEVENELNGVLQEQRRVQGHFDALQEHITKMKYGSQGEQCRRPWSQADNIHVNGVVSDHNRADQHTPIGSLRWQDQARGADRRDQSRDPHAV